ncbi:MAG TPA: hypothetical protein VKY57_14130 [Chitinispirillaceae bacterium]|jgi:hypothetical protein|nr:hypothetical protein [Chitinispirillaceae bacterium]
MSKITDEIKKFIGRISDYNKEIKYFLEEEENAGIPKKSLEIQKRFKKPRRAKSMTDVRKKE